MHFIYERTIQPFSSLLEIYKLLRLRMVYLIIIGTITSHHSKLDLNFSMIQRVRRAVSLRFSPVLKKKQGTVLSRIINRPAEIKRTYKSQIS